MELNLLYLKLLLITLLLITQCLCASTILDGVTKFVRKNEQVTFKCPIQGQETVKSWYVGRDIIKSPDWNPVNNADFKATVHSKEFNYILNITIISNSEVKILCKSNTMSMKFEAITLYNDNGNLYPSSKTPNAIKDKKFTLICNKSSSNASTAIWYTRNGTIIDKYIGTISQVKTKYFGSRQETSCQNKICTLSIIDVSLDEDNISIICRTDIHSSLFNITVFVLPKSVTVKEMYKTIPVEKQNKTYECLIEDTNPEFSVSWQLTKKDGTKKNASKYISNSPSKSGKLISLSSKLTLSLNKNFEKLQCVAYIPGKSELVKYSEELNMTIRYSPEKMTLNISENKVCVGTLINLQCSWKGGYPSGNVTLIYKNVSNTSKEDVELKVTLSKLHSTVKCQGTHIAANVTREKNLTIYYPPERIEIQSDEPFLEGQDGSLKCKASNGYPEKYRYMWVPSNSTSKSMNFSEFDQNQNNEIYTCYASNTCNNKNKLHKKHWINVEYKPDITTSENVTLIENQAAMLNCSAKGNPIPEVRWECGNQSFPSNNLLTFSRRNISDVFCVADANSTKHGILTSKTKIVILLKYPPDVNIHILKERNNAITINCTAFDGNPAYYKYRLEQKWGNTIKNSYDKNILSITVPSFNNTGTWECHVNNDDFHVNKSSNLTIELKPILSSSSEASKNKNASLGDSVIFKECFYSYPKSDVKWMKNEQSIDSDKYSTDDFESSEFPFKGSRTILRIDDIKTKDFGTYTLTLENSEGKTVIMFTLRAKETTETPLGIIIGCTVAIVILLIILGLLAFKCHQIRAVKHNKEFSSTTAINNISTTHAINYEPSDIEDVQVSNDIYESNMQLNELNVENIYGNISQQPNNVEDMYAKVNKPNPTSMKPTDVEDMYAKVNKPNPTSMKPTDVEDMYAKVNKPNPTSMKPTDVEDMYAKVNKPNPTSMKPTDVEDMYAKVNKPKPTSMKPTDGEDMYAKVNKPKPTSMKPTDVEDLYFKVNKPTKDSKKPDDTEDSSPNDIYENKKQENKPESIEECNYAELDFIKDTEKSKSKPKSNEEETIYADICLDC